MCWKIFFYLYKNSAVVAGGRRGTLDGMMGINWLLFGVVLVIAACVYHGYRCGLVRMLFSIATFFLTIILVRFLAPIGVQALKNNEMIYQAVRTPIEKVLEDQVDGTVRTADVLESFQVDEEVKDKIVSAADNFEIENIDFFTPEIKSITADCITLNVIDLLAYVILFIFINVGLRVAGIVLDHFAKLPGIHGVNQLAGSIFGIIEGVVFVWIFFLIVTICSATEWGNWCFQMIGSNQVLSILYAYNLFLVFV